MTLILLVALASTIPVVPIKAQASPEMDVLRFEVIGGVRTPDEVVYLNEFNVLYYEWDNAPESAFWSPDGSYIESDSNADWASLYGFEDISFAGREIEDIQIECYAQYPNGYNDGVDIDFYGFSSVQEFAWLGSGWGTESWGWHEVRWIEETVLDVMPELADETELNNLELLIYNYHGNDPDIIRVDSVRLKIWYKPLQPSARIQAMLQGYVDVLPDIRTTPEIELLDENCFLVTQDLGFNIEYIGFNIRDDQSYRGLTGIYWPLHDADFRHALVHCYDQLGIIPPIYGYVVTPIHSLVPPAQSKYYTSAVPTHPYNPGNPFTSPSGEHSTVGILKAAGYTFVDAGTIGVVDAYDYWKCPDGSPLPSMTLWTPFRSVMPTTYQHVAEFIADLAGVGLAATAPNDDHGLKNVAASLNWYMWHVYRGLFDAYVTFDDVDRLPTQLHSLLHSSQDSYTHPGRRNAPGVSDTTIDGLVEQVLYNLDPDGIEAAAKEVQERLYDPTLPNADDFALAYMMMHSRSYYNAFNNNLTGVIKSPGYGSNNQWTFLNINWKPGTGRLEDVYGDSYPETVLIWNLEDEPGSFNPLWANTNYEWQILDRLYDGLTNVNPYNHYDIPWMASDWTITPVGDGMDVSFVLRDDVEWQDGKPFTAYDIQWCLEFLRDREIPQHYSSCAHIIDVVVTDATHFSIECDEAGLGLFYDLSRLGALLPRHIWDRPWTSSQEILDWDPTGPYEVAPGYTPGPHPTPTNVMGTGPYTYQFYDTINRYCDMYRDPNYFMSQTDVADLMTNMFWEVGDCNKNGIVNEVDMYFVQIAFGAHQGDPNYNPDADFDSNGWVDTHDMANVAFHLLWQREYEKPPCTPEALVQEEIELIESWDLNAGMENSLTGKLEDALTLLEQGNINGAIHKLQDLLTKVQNDAKHLTQAQKDHLLQAIPAIIELIESRY